MDLAIFVKETLLGINKGVHEANENTEKKPFRLNNGNKIEFDIAVQVVNGKNRGVKGGAGVSISNVIKVAEVDVEGTDHTSEGNFSRIKFSVDVAQFTHKGIR
jgi:hypothetical protein